jgi:hypothetical protein
MVWYHCSECSCSNGGWNWWYQGQLLWRPITCNQFPKYHTKILFGDFNEKVGREDISKLTIENETLNEISNALEY